MCLFKKWRQKRKAKKIKKEMQAKEENLQEVKNEEIAKDEDLNKAIDEKNIETPNENITEEKETVEKLKIRPFSKPQVSNQEENPWPKEEKEVQEKEEHNLFAYEAEEKKEKAKKKKSSSKESHRKYSGKYEIYPESDFYKFRLKASNGEILCVSFRYSSERGAMAGIETFKKNVEEGQFKVVTDKNNFTQFHLYTANGARLVMVGELYQTVQKANSAVESVKSFYQSEKTEVLDEIPKSEIREEAIVFDDIEESDKGKYEIFKEEDLYFVRLRASNSQILFLSQGYASKASAKSGIKTIQKAINERSFTVSKDKQNRYQFNLYSSNGQIIVTGETYSAKSNGISAAHSVVKFGLKAAIVDL
jgi:hypothetical protein